MHTDTILLIVGVVGLSISGWVLRGYFINTPNSSPTSPNEATPAAPEPVEAGGTSSVGYVTKEDHQLVIDRLVELEKGGYTVKVEENSNVNAPTGTVIPESDKQPTSVINAEPDPAEPDSGNDKWKEIFALQEAYRLERAKEQDIDYEREQALFDISQGYNGRYPGREEESDLSEDELTEQRLQDNQTEEGEDLDAYQERLNKFASLTREMLIMRLEATDRQLKEQYERHQATLLNIIATLIERMPGDVNLKSVAQSSFVSASTEISNEEGESNRTIFQEMFYKNFGH